MECSRLAPPVADMEDTMKYLTLAAGMMAATMAVAETPGMSTRMSPSSGEGVHSWRASSQDGARSTVSEKAFSAAP